MLKKLWLVVILLITACSTLGPDYQEPDVVWLSNWQPNLYDQLEETSNSKDVNLAAWWHIFGDDSLNQLIQQGVANNLNLRIAGLRILESRAQLGIAGSNLYPQLQQLNGSVIGAETRSRGGLFPDNDQSVVNYQAGFNLGWELDFWGKYQRGVEAADAAFFASVANQQNMQVLLTSQLADFYFTYRTIEKRIAIAKKNSQIQKRSFDITKQIYQEGQDSELDLQQAKAQYLATLSTIPKLQLALINTRNAISLLLARPPGTIPELTTTPQQLPIVSTITLQDIPTYLIARRPDVRTSAWQVAITSAQIGIAESDYYPSISLLGSVSWSGNSASAVADNGLIGIGPGFTWNVFDHGRIANNIRVQDARFQQSVEQYQQTVLAAAREVDDAAIGMVKTSEQITILAQAVEASERALSLANTRYREGYSSFQRVLDAQRSVFSQTEQEIINRGNHLGSVVDLYKSLGGGWAVTPIDAVIPQQLKQTLKMRTDWGDILNSPHTEDSVKSPSVHGEMQYE